MLVKVEWSAIVWWKNGDDMLSRFHPIPERNGRTDRRTDGRTDLLYQYRASVCWRVIKMHSFLRHGVVCNAGRHSPSSDLLHSLHWLPICHRIEFKTATLCFKAVKLGTPSYLNNMLKPYALRALRSSNMDLLTVPRTDTSLGLRRFSVAGPRVWNRLPHELRQCSTLSSFKSNLKTHYSRRHMDN